MADTSNPVSAQVGGNQADTLSSLLNTFLHKVNNNPETSNYIGNEDDDAFNELEAGLTQLLSISKKPDVITYPTVRSILNADELKQGETYIRITKPGNYAVSLESVTDLRLDNPESEKKA